MIHFLQTLYGPFFDLNNWKTVIESGSDWLIILSLVLIECLLSVDNAIVLAAQTQKLPTKKEQEKSLFYGLWGAYLFRFLLIGVGTFLIKFWWIKVIGAGYLLYLSIDHFWKMAHPHSDQHQSKKRKRILPLFWSVVVSIELMDIVFSVDSILAHHDVVAFTRTVSESLGEEKKLIQKGLKLKDRLEWQFYNSKHLTVFSIMQSGY